MKRSRENQAAAPNKKQTTLLSMFKPVANASSTATGTNVEALRVSTGTGTGTKQKNPSDLFKNVDQETLDLLDLEITSLNYGWLKELAPELTKAYFLKLKKYLKEEIAAKKTIFPPLNQIYSWSNYTPPSKVKVVILGQDPYHNFNQAHGLCFSVIKGVKVPPSLVNVYKALQIDYPDFKIPTHGYLEEWAKQGVLLLNTSLSVEAHKAGSHANQGWEQFTDAVIKYLNEKRVNIVFMLWGSHAQKKGARINKSKHCVLSSVHPSPLSAHRGFFESGHFKKANEYLKEHGQDEINWNCLV
ncbi:uracil-DNA glycosylase-like protein [Parasitella parasitica]|nr:uracil-DNA glycosylase-like protein [Parasitella parasitica]